MQVHHRSILPHAPSAVSFNDLPSDLVLVIAQLVPGRRTRCALLSACRFFHGQAGAAMVGARMLHEARDKRRADRLAKSLSVASAPNIRISIRDWNWHLRYLRRIDRFDAVLLCLGLHAPHLGRANPALLEEASRQLATQCPVRALESLDCLSKGPTRPEARGTLSTILCGTLAVGRKRKDWDGCDYALLAAAFQEIVAKMPLVEACATVTELAQVPAGNWPPESYPLAACLCRVASEWMSRGRRASPGMQSAATDAMSAALSCVVRASREQHLPELARQMALDSPWLLSLMPRLPWHEQKAQHRDWIVGLTAVLIAEPEDMVKLELIGLGAALDSHGLMNGQQWEAFKDEAGQGPSS